MDAEFQRRELQRRKEEATNLGWLQTLIQNHYFGDKGMAELAAEELNEAMRRLEEPPKLNKHQLQVLLRILASKMAPSLIQPRNHELALIFAPPGT